MGSRRRTGATAGSDDDYVPPRRHTRATLGRDDDYVPPRRRQPRRAAPAHQAGTAQHRAIQETNVVAADPAGKLPP